MRIHRNARLTFARRLDLVDLVTNQGLTPSAAAAALGVSAPTVRKWLGRYLAEGPEGLEDRSSKPARSPKALDPKLATTVVELRRRRLTQAKIAAYLGLAKSTVQRVLARANLSRWRDLEPAPPVIRYEHAAPGDMLHIDIKKLGRIERPSHRVTKDRRDTVKGAGWEYLFVSIDDHARIAFTDLHPNEQKESAVRFLEAAVDYYKSLGVSIQRLLTDNGSAFRSKAFAATCSQLGIRHSFTKPYHPQTNGKAERFIQSALREWAYGIPYQHSAERADMLRCWNDHYNWHRPHRGIGGSTPIARLGASGNNLLGSHN